MLTTACMCSAFSGVRKGLTAFKPAASKTEAEEFDIQCSFNGDITLPWIIPGGSKFISVLRFPPYAWLSCLINLPVKVASLHELNSKPNPPSQHA